MGIGLAVIYSVVHSAIRSLPSLSRRRQRGAEAA